MDSRHLTLLFEQLERAMHRHAFQEMGHKEARRLKGDLVRFRHALDRAILGPDSSEPGDIRERTLTDDRLSRTESVKRRPIPSQFKEIDPMLELGHEIKTPMLGIIGLLDRLRDSGLDDFQRRITDGIGEAASRLITITERLMDTGRVVEPAAVTDTPLTCPVAIRPLVHNVLFLVRNLIVNPSLQLHVEMGDGIPETSRDRSQPIEPTLIDAFGRYGQARG